MEKKGDPLNQLAIISDLVERLNLKTEHTTLVIVLSVDEFKNMFDLVQKKYNKKTDLPDDTFKITINDLEIVFSTNNA